MAHHKSAKKRIKVSLKKRARNKQYLSKVRTAVKKFRLLVSEAGANSSAATGDSPDAVKSQILAKFRSVQSLLARAHSKGIVHRNTAARKTKRLHALLKKATS
ncbi:MAG: 30S ribosomal protein S20 [Pseudomonadota bacterium]|nr:30S ribosomal protein S20 [Pseudomonadota bacterium]